MLEEQLVDKLMQNRKRMDELTKTLCVDMIDDTPVDSSSLAKLMISVSNCMNSVSSLFKRGASAGQSDSVGNAVALISGNNVRDGLMMLNRLARESDVNAQLKIAELHCLGLNGSPIDGQNQEYGMTVLNRLIQREIPTAFYTMGVYQKRVPDVVRALSNFETSYKYGVQKAFPELIALYKGLINETSSVEKKLLFTQKLNNIKSELTYE